MNGRSIRVLRRSRGWTQADLAERLGTDAVTVSRWERGISHARPSAQARLRELKAPIPSGLSTLARVIGIRIAERQLQRVALLAHRLPRARYAADPTIRLREVERARRDQIALKASARLAT